MKETRAISPEDARMLALIRAAVADLAQEAVVWTTAAKAAARYGIGEAKIKEMIQQGIFVGYQKSAEDDARRPWMVDVRSIDRYHLQQAMEYQGEVRRVLERVERRIRR